LLLYACIYLEPLIDSGSSAWRAEMFRIKAKSAGNSRLLRNFSTQSRGIFSRHAPVHELIRGSLVIDVAATGIAIKEAGKRRVFGGAG
jgi:hypothetical protein